MDGIQMATGHFVAGTSFPAQSTSRSIQHDLRGRSERGIRNVRHHLRPGSDVNILIERNLLAGGAFTLYCEQDAKGTNYRVANNHFSLSSARRWATTARQPSARTKTSRATSTTRRGSP